MSLNNKIKKYIFLLIFCVLIIFIIYFFTRKNPTLDIPDILVIKETAVINKPDVTVKNFTFKEYDKKREYSLMVNTCEGTFFHATNTALCDTITCTVLKNNIEVAHIHAQHALIKRDVQEIFFTGPVNGNFKDILLESTDLCYNFSSHTLTTTKKITYSHPHALFSAQKSTLDIKNFSISMHDGVYSEFFSEPRDKQPTP